MPTGVLAELAQSDALGNAHVLGTLLAPYGVVAIPPLSQAAADLLKEGAIEASDAEHLDNRTPLRSRLQ
jgi:hypothetical protein